MSLVKVNRDELVGVMTKDNAKRKGEVEIIFRHLSPADQTNVLVTLMTLKQESEQIEDDLPMR